MRHALTRWLLLALLPLLAACGAPAPHRQEAYVFGTRIEVLVVGVGQKQAQAAVGEVLREFDRLHRDYHAWQPSKLMDLNTALAAGQGLEVDAEMAELLLQAQRLAALGDHLFDPGIGRLVALWGFHTDEIAPRLPDAAAIAALASRKPSIAQLRIEGRQMDSTQRDIAVDFGGYLKGVALDRAATILKRHGIANALINIGGNILALGSKNGRPWRVGIQHPRPARVGNVPLASLELFDGEAIGTSGDYHRYFEVEGRRYCHLIDPRSGRPTSGTQALTVLIPPGGQSGTLSDASSKPLFIAGEDWQALAKRLGLGAVLRVAADGSVQATPTMAERLSIEAPDVRLQRVE